MRLCAEINKYDAVPRAQCGAFVPQMGSGDISREDGDGDSAAGCRRQLRAETMLTRLICFLQLL